MLSFILADFTPSIDTLCTILFSFTSITSSEPITSIFNVSKKSEFEKKYEKILKDIELTGFKNAALIHSVSDSASVGGYIGWIKENNLNENIKNKVSNLKIGEFSKPILTSSGFLIIKVEDEKKYEIDFNLDREIKNLIQFKTNEQLNQFSRLYFNKVKKDIIFNEL